MDHSNSPQAHSLKKNAIGLGLLVFLVISAAAPLTGIAGAIPIAMLLGNGAGIPGTFILMSVILAIWALGFVALARRIRNAGAFYAYSARALGGRFGGAIALIAVLLLRAIAAVCARLPRHFQRKRALRCPRSRNWSAS